MNYQFIIFELMSSDQNTKLNRNNHTTHGIRLTVEIARKIIQRIASISKIMLELKSKFL